MAALANRAKLLETLRKPYFLPSRTRGGAATGGTAQKEKKKQPVE